MEFVINTYVSRFDGSSSTVRIEFGEFKTNLGFVVFRGVGVVWGQQEIGWLGQHSVPLTPTGPINQFRRGHKKLCNT